jgi:hypothetical protein
MEQLDLLSEEDKSISLLEDFLVMVKYLKFLKDDASDVYFINLTKV